MKDKTTRRGFVTGILGIGAAGAVSVVTAQPAEARRHRYHNKGRRPTGGNMTGKTPTTSDTPTGVLLNPLDYQDNDAGHTFPMGTGAYVQCERAFRTTHTDHEAHVTAPGGTVATVTWSAP